MNNSISNLRVVRQKAEDLAAVTHQLVSEDAERLRRIVALSKAPARELGHHIRDVADWQQSRAILHVEAYRLARQAAGSINAALDTEGAA